MEHRGDRHVDIVGAHQADAVQAADGRSHRQGMQHQLPVAEIHTLGVAGGAGGVEGGGHRVLVEIGERVARTGGGQQGLVLADTIGQRAGLVRTVGDQQGLFHRGQLPGDALVERGELAVDQHEAVVGVVHGVEDLFRRKADVDGVQHRTDHRDGEHALQVAVTVPVHHRHRVTGLHPGVGQYVGQARHTLVERGIGVTHLVAVDDLPALFITTAGQQQALDQQRVLIGVLSSGDDAGFQHGVRTLKAGFRVESHQDETDSRALRRAIHQSKE